MALLLLLSTVSWTVDKHLCMGRVMDISFFAQAEDCGMDVAATLLETIDNHCCDDESFTIEGQDDLKLTWNDIQLGHQVVLATFAQSYLGTLLDIDQLPIPLHTYPPPFLVQDLNILHEVFLI
ncbi:hypothetical protein VC82_967 [Flagellimonas lutaonensis]|uniref:Secreted protein n=2 Tax=Flagellimonas lutaonensis TaxID=516051 RepID=A0A0D5YQQ3_9FLAO|nr:hypothetical protein [Allomuricauda lutaonensis]AKA34615.1 hypothetical protein VC82_967 [Allomuricauda lutaonensis]